MIRYQTEMDGLPEKPQKKHYKDFVELFEDKSCCEDIKLSVLGNVLQMATHNSVTKAELLAMLRWVVDENYYWEKPEPKPNLRVVK